MFYHPSKNNDDGKGSNNDSKTINLEKTARLCWLDTFSTQTLSNIHSICLFCNQLLFESLQANLYSQPSDEKIHKQNVSMCEKCSNDFEDYQTGFLSREQYSLDMYDYEHGIPEPQKPKLCIGDYYTVAL